ncbi:helix-turn-helix domain-containing protein [Nonomuraea salmonea]|uniref:winged helix-turn-helix transcriptional regulator n=1 Tax=Nonomuraea salmonea TaxID=46181 RepID=UPI0031EAC140
MIRGDGGRTIRAILDRICNKWTLLIVATLDQGSLRFTDLHQQIPGISQRMLTLTLRNLERDGLVSRTVHAEVPPRVEYALTPPPERASFRPHWPSPAGPSNTSRTSRPAERPIRPETFDPLPRLQLSALVTAGRWAPPMRRSIAVPVPRYDRGRLRWAGEPLSAAGEQAAHDP